MRYAILLITLVITGCASSYNPVVDVRTSDMTHYQRDLAECRGYASEANPAKDAVIGGLVGAGIGAAFGAITGMPGYGAMYGATAGGAYGGVGAAADQVNIINNCLRGRGYSVLR